ncbi:MAG TPA: Hsp20/alpha crystallin family protein [Candidatus Magasanikbacteria bacterium]|nr:Hsp20/alpha crystallin family protein [Candidatus Magasanikbacteria bacterium]
MPLIRWSPVWEPFEEIDEMFNHLPALSNAGQIQKAFAPAMDVYQTDKAVVVEAPLAGVRPENVSVSVEKGILTVQGRAQKEREVDEKNYYRKEVHSGSFFRQIVIPAPVLEDKVEAEFNDGILKITCPKAGKNEAKKVEIKVKKSVKK